MTEVFDAEAALRKMQSGELIKKRSAPRGVTMFIPKKTIVPPVEPPVVINRTVGNDKNNIINEKKLKFQIGGKAYALLDRMYSNPDFNRHNQNIKTPFILIQEATNLLIAEGYTINHTIGVYYCVEFVIYLIKVLNVPKENIFFYDDGVREATNGGRIMSLKKQLLVDLFGFPVVNIHHTVVKKDIIMTNEKKRPDFVIANPPYQDSNNSAKNNKLWHSFTRDILEDRQPNYAAVIICPSSIFKYEVGIGEWFKKQQELGKFHVTAARVHNPPAFENVSVETCHYIAKIGKGNVYPSPLDNNPHRSSILSKLESYPIKLNLVEENKQLGQLGKSLNGTGTIKVAMSGVNKFYFVDEKYVPDNTGQLKIVVSFSSSYKTQLTTKLPTCQLNRVIYVEDEAHADRIRSYTTSKLYIYFAAHYRRTSGFTPAVKNNKLPKLDDSKMWTDAEVYQFFNLTEAEVREVENYFAPKAK